MEYKFLEQLGAGGYGNVWKAKNKSGKIVAIKVISLKKNKNVDVYLKSLIDEADTLSKLTDKCRTPKYIEHYNDDENFYIVSEYIKGITLRKYLEITDIKQNTDLIWSLFYFLVDGLRCIHNQGYAHRDIKLDNIMITDDNTITYIDFGLACVENCKRENCTNKCNNRGGGTLYYNPPEYYDPDFKNYNILVAKAKDIWSLGVVLFNIANGYGKFPYKFVDTVTFIGKIKNTEPLKSNYKNDDNVNIFVNSLLIKKIFLRPNINEIYDNINTYVKNYFNNYLTKYLIGNLNTSNNTNSIETILDDKKIEDTDYDLKYNSIMNSKDKFKNIDPKISKTQSIDYDEE